MQASSCITQLNKLQATRLKSMFADSDDAQEKKQVDLEHNFKRLVAKCKSKLNHIDKRDMSEISHRVTSHMSESVLLQIQELTAQYTAYKKAQRQFDKDYDSSHTISDTDESSSFFSDFKNTTITSDDDLTLELASSNTENQFVDRSKDIERLTKDMGQMSELFQKM